MSELLNSSFNCAVHVENDVVADLMAVNFQSSRVEIVINISQVDFLLPHRRWQRRQMEEELQKGRG